MIEPMYFTMITNGIRNLFLKITSHRRNNSQLFVAVAGGAGAGGQASAQDRDAQLAARRRGHVPDDCHPPAITCHRSEVQVGRRVACNPFWVPVSCCRPATSHGVLAFMFKAGRAVFLLYEPVQLL
jgi:hypothetical protein